MSGQARISSYNITMHNKQTSDENKVIWQTVRRITTVILGVKGLEVLVQLVYASELSSFLKVYSGLQLQLHYLCLTDKKQLCLNNSCVKFLTRYIHENLRKCFKGFG